MIIIPVLLLLLLLPLQVDQVVAVIGEVGRWQLEKILIVFIAAAPGETCSCPSQGVLEHPY